jgi:hypothetical protein
MLLQSHSMRQALVEQNDSGGLSNAYKTAGLFVVWMGGFLCQLQGAVE